jgi:DNA primase large subunit
LFSKIFSTKNIFTVGDIARQEITLDEIAFVIPKINDQILEAIENFNDFTLIEKSGEFISYKYQEGIRIKIYSTTENHLVQT